MRKSNLRASAALHALALMGAGVSTAFIAAAPAAAQDYTNVQATGRVQGTNGQSVAGATVTLTSEGQGFTRSTTTDSSGAFQFTQLVPGNYTFSIAAPGFDTLTETGVSVTLNNAANEFTIAPVGGTAAAAAVDGGEVVVTGRRRLVDFTANTTGAVIEVGELATRVPVARDITSVVLLSPGTALGDNAFGNLPSINGASVSENVYYINGLNITSFRNGLGSVTVPFDFYQQVEVKNGGIPAEFGRTTGGFVNSTTKRGTNQFHGGVSFNFEPDSLRSNSPDTFGTDNDSVESDRKEAIVQLSGPIIKDHLFFYGIYNFRDVQFNSGFTGTASTTTTGANACTTNPTVCRDFADLRDANLTLQGTQYIRDRNRSPFFGGKVDAVLDGHRLEGTYFDTSGKTIRNTFGTALFTLASGDRFNPNTNDPGAFASTTVFRSGGKNYVGRYTGQFTDWLTLSAAYGVNKQAATVESSTPDLPAINDTRGGTSTGVGNTTANSNVSFEKRTFYRADADVTFNLFGRHHVRGGYDREDLTLDNFIQANGGSQITLSRTGGTTSAANPDPTTGLTTPNTDFVLARTFVSGGVFDTRNSAFYIQDQWSLFDSRLQLNLGVRNDRFVSRNADGDAFYESGNQWAPRLGFSADPFGTGRTKVYGSFSRYFLPVAVNTNLRLAGSELDFDAFFRLTGQNANSTPILGAPITTGPGFEACPAGGPAGTSCIVRNDGSVPGTDTTVASNLKPQSTDEYILGAEHRIGRMRFGIFGTYTKLNESLEDASIDQAIVPLCVAAGNAEAACRGIFNGVHQYALINPGSDVAITLSDPFPNQTTAQTVVLSAADLQYPRARRTYKAVTFTFDREFDGVWSLSANYTLSKTRGNIEGGIRSDNGQTDSGLTTAFDLPALVNGSFGKLPNDARHNLKIYGSYRLFDWLRLGGNLQIASPRSFGCLGRAPNTADGTVGNPAGLAGRFYGANAFYCNVDANGDVVRNPVGFTLINDRVDRVGGPRPSTLQLTPRGSQFKSDWLALLNVDGAIRLPVEAFDATLRVSVFNILNRKAKTDFNEFGTVGSGTPSATYSLPNAYQAPRSVRFQLGVDF